MNREEVRDALTGPVTSICLPFDNDGNIDFDGLCNQIDFNFTQLIAYFVCCDDSNVGLFGLIKCPIFNGFK